MPRTALVTVAVLTTFLVVLGCVGPTAAAADERWRRPLPGGAIVAPFTYERATPYAHGRRRGIDIRGRAGAPVLAACSGRITYAGRVPRFGRGVTILCGDLVATELGLAKTSPPRGSQVARGSIIGLLGPTGTLRLGARLSSDAHAYIDPEPLLSDQPPQLAPLPPLRHPHHPHLHPHSFDPRPVPSSPPLPLPVLIGAATLVSAALGGTTLRIRRRRRVLSSATAPTAPGTASRRV